MEIAVAGLKTTTTRTTRTRAKQEQRQRQASVCRPNQGRPWCDGL